MPSFPKGKNTQAEWRRYQQHVPWGVPADPYAGFLLFDSVTRADSTTSAGTPTEKGTAWTAATGTSGVTSHKLYVPAGSSLAYLTHDVGTSEYTFTATVGSDDYTLHQPALLVRYIDANNNLAVRMTSTTTATLFKCVAGSFTALGAYTFTAITNGQPVTMIVTARGNVIGLTANGGAGGTLTLAGADATQFGSGTTNVLGLRSHVSALETFTAISVAP